MDNVHLLMVLTYFISLFYIFNMFLQIDLSLFGLTRLAALFLAVSFLIPIKLYRIKFTMSIYEYILLNFLAITPALLALMLSLNYNLRGDMYSETYRIASIERLERKTIYHLKDDQYQQAEYLRTIADNEEIERTNNKYLSIYFSDGLFGIRVIEKKQLH
jgi:hypothetical protein